MTTMPSNFTCKRTGTECGSVGYCPDCTLPELEPWNVPHMGDKANDAHCSELLGTAGGAVFDVYEDEKPEPAPAPAPDSSRGSVQMIGGILALVAVSTLAMLFGLVFAVGRGFKWW